MSGDTADECSLALAHFDLSDEPSSSNSEESSDTDTEDSQKPKKFKDSRSGQIFVFSSWFMEPCAEIFVVWDKLDVYHKQASHHSWRCCYQDAYKTYNQILTEFEHKDGRRNELIDAMVYCALRGKQPIALESAYTALKDSVTTFGDQINLWTASITIAECRGGSLVSPFEHLCAVVYLATTAECGRHWIMFDKISDELIPKKSKFRLGTKVRTFFLLKQEHSRFKEASDSVERLLENLMGKVKSELQSEYSEAEIVAAMNEFCSDLVKVENPVTEEITNEPPPHACKLDGVVKSIEELDTIRQHFAKRFAGLFDELSSVSEELCKSQLPKPPTPPQPRPRPPRPARTSQDEESEIDESQADSNTGYHPSNEDNDDTDDKSTGEELNEEEELALSSRALSKTRSPPPAYLKR